ncbi:MAG: AI-2E family transporter [Deltaproteobacteria bacterium]|nr:AI-2E family transporter [Deltaproteobacteria bacterium]
MTKEQRNILVYIGVFAGILFLLYVLRKVFIPVFLGFLIAYIFKPIVDRLERRRISRGVSAVLVIFFLTILAATFVLIIFPLISDIVTAISGAGPKIISLIEDKLRPYLLDKFQIDISDTIEGYKERLYEFSSNLAGKDFSFIGGLLKRAISNIFMLAYLLVALILIPLIAYYFIVYYYDVIKWIDSMIPLKLKGLIDDIFKEIDSTMSMFFRGQITVCTVMAIIYSVALLIAKVPNPVAIGVITGVLNFIPYAGLITGLSLSLLLSLIYGNGLYPIFGSLIVYSAIPLIDQFFITPRIMGSSIGLKPIFIILALLIGGTLMGFIGILIAVPSAAIIKVLAGIFIEKYKQSSLYLAD